jgi:hypothetical protein
MRCGRPTRREFCASLLVLAPAVHTAGAALRHSLRAVSIVEPEPPVSAFRVIRRPCSLQKICRALSRRFGVGVAPDQSLADQRVVWAFQHEPTLEVILGRLAELTDSRVAEHSSEQGKRRLILERKPETARREAAWRTEALRRTIQELLRAADADEHGQLRPETFSKNVQSYLDLGRAPQLKYLRLLTPEQMGRLLQGELVRFAPGAVPEAEIRQIVKERYSGSDSPDERAEDLQKYHRSFRWRSQRERGS